MSVVEEVLASGAALAARLSALEMVDRATELVIGRESADTNNRQVIKQELMALWVAMRSDRDGDVDEYDRGRVDGVRSLMLAMLLMEDRTLMRTLCARVYGEATA